MAQKHYSLMRCAGLLLTATLFGGCSLWAPRPAPTGAPPSDSAPPSASPAEVAAATPPAAPGAPPSRPPPPARENRLSPATRSLVTQAHSQAARGDLDAASSTLDRALRIEPNNPLLWVELGRVRLTESASHQAEVCGRKALALASGDRGTQRQAGQLMADALRAQHRNPEAQAVESQPFMAGGTAR